jgi:uncharacterized DUF497 family protein
VANIRFEWDEAKNLANQRKHGISFEQAMLAFRDLLYTSKERIEGKTPIQIVRIITARRETRKERRRYENENGQL